MINRDEEPRQDSNSVTGTSTNWSPYSSIILIYLQVILWLPHSVGSLTVCVGWSRSLLDTVTYFQTAEKKASVYAPLTEMPGLLLCTVERTVTAAITEAWTGLVTEAPLLDKALGCRQRIDVLSSSNGNAKILKFTSEAAPSAWQRECSFCSNKLVVKSFKANRKQGLSFSS